MSTKTSEQSIAKSKQDGGCRDLGPGDGERVFGRRGLRAEAGDVLRPSGQCDRPHTDSVRPSSEMGPGASREVFLRRKATQVSTSWEPVKESGGVKWGEVGGMFCRRCRCQPGAGEAGLDVLGKARARLSREPSLG